MLQLTNVTKSFVHKTVLDGIDLQIGAQSRMGLIGRNGCGKSTLLSIIMGENEIDSGSIYRAPGLQVNCLTQEPRITPGNTLEVELKSVFAHVNNLHEEEAHLIEQLGVLEGDAQMKAIERLADVHRDMARWDAATIDARVSRMATDLGFTLEELNRPVEQFSGGWQMRINLAKVMLEGADILLLDEPTNHLDLETCMWLEGFLSTYPGGLVVVSHDRRFLDNLVTEIAEVELGRMTVWTGNYTKYLEQKADAMDKLQSAADRQQKDLAKQTAFVERFRASATKSTQAKSREKQLNKIERIEVPQTDNRVMSIRFPSPDPSGKQVMALNKLTKSFGERTLFRDVSVEIQRGKRIFLLGENGCGKTTLLRLILGIDSPDSGEVKLGHNARIGYFSQNQLETLDPNLSMFDTLHNARPEMTQTEIRGILGRFLFTGEQVFKPVSVLSGGEKSKLALAKLMLSGPNMLLLDEPTNHMDIPAKEVMEGAFRDFEGSVLCISHDRHFIQQLATEIWEIHNGQLIQYPGDYDYYLDQRDTIREIHRKAAKPAAKSAPAKTVSASQTSPLKERREVEKRVKQLEKSIVTLEAELESLNAELLNPDIQQDYQKLDSLGKQVKEKQDLLHQHNQEWESLAEQLEG